VADNQHDIVLTLDASAFERGIQQAIAILGSLGQVADSVSSKLQNIVNSINLGNFTNQINAANKATSELGNNALGLSKIQEVLQKATGVTEPLVQGLQSVGTKAGEATANIRSLITSTEGASTDKVTKPLLTGMEAAQKAIKNTSITIDDLVARVEAAGRRIETVSEKEFKGFVRSLEAQRQSIQNQRVNTAGNDDSFKIDKASDTTVLVGLAKAIETVKQKLKEAGQEVSDFTLKKLAVIELNKEFEHAKNIIFGVTKASKELGTALNDIRPPDNFVGPLSRDQTQQIAALDKATLILNQDQQNADRIARQYGLSIEELNKKLADLISTASKSDEIKGLNKELSTLAKPVAATPVVAQPTGFVGPPTPQSIEAVAKAQVIVKQNFDLINTAAAKAGKSIETVTAEIAKQIQTIQSQKAKQGLNEIVNSLTGVGTEAKKTAGLLDYLVRGLEIGVAHSVGAISVGANVIRSLTHEIVRNLSISVFNFGLKNFKASLDESTVSLKNVAQATGDIAAPAKRASETLNEINAAAGGAGGNISNFFKAIDFGALAAGAGLLFIGKLLDDLGDKLINLSKDLAKTAGDAQLSFEKLSSVLSALTTSTGDNFGTADKWKQSIQDLSLQSGKSQKDLNELALSFTQVGVEAGLSGKEIRELLKVAAFTGNQFRNQTEQLSNFRRALGGELRFLQSNLGTPADFNTANQKLIQTFQQQGLSIDEAKAKLEAMNVAQRALAVIQIAAEPIIKTNTELTGNYSREVEKLTTSVENLKIQLGSGGLQDLFAGIVSSIRGVIDGFNKLPDGVLKAIGTFIGAGSIVVEVAAKLLKFSGIVLIVAAAWASLNKILNIGVLAGGGSIFGAFSKGVTAITGFETSVNTLGGAFKVLLKTLGDVRRQFLSFSAIGGAILRLVAPLLTINGLLGLLASSIEIASVAFGVFLKGIQLAFVIAVLSELVKVLKEVDKETGIISDSIKTMRDVFKESVGAVAELTKEFHLLERAGAAVAITAQAIGQAFRGAAFLKLIAQQTSASDLAKQAERNSERALQRGDVAAAKKFQEEAAKQEKRVIELTGRLDALQDKVNQTNNRIGALSNTLFATNQQLEIDKRSTLDLTDAVIKLDDETRHLNKTLSQEQINVIDAAVKSLRTEIDNLKLKRIELLSGEEAKAQAERILELKRLLTNVFEEGVKKPTPGGNVFTLEDIENAKTINDLMALLNRAVNFGSEEAKKLKNALDLKATLAESIPPLQRQRDLFKEIIELVQTLGNNFRKDANIGQEALRLQERYNTVISQSTDNFDALVKKAQLENEIRKATLEVERKIKDVQDRIANGKTVVTAIGKTIKVELNEEEKTKAQSELNLLTEDKVALIRVEVDKASAKRSADVINDIQKQIEGITLFFRDNIRALEDENSLLTQYLSNLKVGVDFAQQQNTINTKSLEIDREIRKNKDELVKTDQQIADFAIIGKPEEIERLKKLRETLQLKLKEAEFAKQVVIEGTKRNQQLETQKRITEEIVKINEALVDGLKAVDEKAGLFKEGVLKGDFSAVTEKISVLTSALENLLAERRKLLVLKDQDIIAPGQIEKATAEIDELKESLKAFQFVKGIQDALNVVADAFEQVITDGVRGVFEGTQKISDLFRNMAKNVLLSLASLTAKNAIEGIKNQFGDLAEYLAKSDIAKSIAGWFGIDLSKLNVKIGTPTDQLKTATIANKDATVNLTASVTNLDNTIKSVGGNLGTPQTIPLGNTVPVIPPIDYGKIAQDIKDGNIVLTETTTEAYSKYFQDLTGYVQFGFAEVEKVSEEGCLGFFGSLKDLLSVGFNKVKDFLGLKDFDFTGLANKVLSFFKLPTIPVAPSAGTATGTAATTATAQVAQTSNTAALNLLNVTVTQTNVLLTQILAKLATSGIPGFSVPSDPLSKLTAPDGSVLGSQGATLSNSAGSDITDEFTQDFLKGFEESIQEALPAIDELTNTIGDTLAEGFEGATEIASEVGGEFFDAFSDVLSEGFSGLGGEGGGEGIFGTLLSSLGGLFGGGAAKGGLISGTPSKKDDQVKRVASGEFITNSEAVGHYGEEGLDLLHAFNNLSLPKNFFENLQDNSASSSLQQIRPTMMAPKVVAAPTDDRPIHITIIDKAPKLDPASFKMKPEEVTQIVVDGVRKDKVIRRTIREDMGHGST
jgi:hypothetical protein